MNEQQPAEQIQFSEQDVADLAAIGVTEGNVPEFHPILEVWRKVMEPIEGEAAKPVTPQYANRMVTQYQGVSFADMLDFHHRYYGKLLEMRAILDLEIATDADCLTYRSPEEDVEHNTGHYKNLLTTWQLAFLQWELDWDCQDPLAGVELGAISEVHKFMFGDTGILAFLDNIKFEYTEQDQAALAAALNALRDAHLEG